MSITVPEFRAKFPEFADDTKYPDEMVQAAIDQAVCMVGNGSNWCSECFYDNALCNLVAHLLTLRTNAQNGSTGSVSSVTGKTVGNVSVTFQALTTNSNLDQFYMSTVYGQMFLQLRNTCFIGFMTINTGSC